MLGRRWILGIASVLLALVVFPSAALATDVGSRDGNGVYETQMVPWKYADHALDGKLADWDGVYRVTYEGTDVTTPSGLNHYGQHAAPNVAVDDDSFYEPYHAPDEANQRNLVTIDIDFGGKQKFQQIVYGSRRDIGDCKGFATEFNVYVDDAESSDGWKKVAHGTGSRTSQLCVFEVCPEDETVEASKVRFEFLHSQGGHPSCRCLRFYRHDPNEHVLEGLWSDYTQTSFRDDLDADEVKGILDDLAKTPSYEVTYEPYVDRARAVANGEVHFQKELERVNAPKAGDSRVKTSRDFLRIGALADYARNKMKFPNGTTDRQVTGVWYPSGTVAHIWVHTDHPGDKLPKVSFAQPYGYWASWIAGAVQLKEGENVIEIPTRKTLDYKTYDIVAGMAVYIENPWTEQEQQGNVSVYFEGGREFPVFHKGDSVDAYMDELREHADRVRNDHLDEMDVTELVGDHVIMTVQATRADEIYGASGHDPQANLVEWDRTIERCLEFEGIPMSADEEDDFAVNGNYQVKWDPRNNHLNENFRVSQVWDYGWMFTAGEHIGVYDDPSAQDVLIDCLDEWGKSNIGPNWGLIHEWGHSVDIPARSIQETTNNMAPYYESTFYPEFRRNEEDIARANRMALPNYENGTMQAENRYNFMPFWLVESYFPGWWGKMSNLYRLVPANEENGFVGGKDQLTKSERMVLYASIAAGYDLRYWFDKWGLQIDTAQKKFSLNDTSEEFKTQWEKHKDEIEESVNGFDAEENPLPLWYEDRGQYLAVTGAGGDPENLHVYGTEAGLDNGAPRILGVRHGTKDVTRDLGNGQTTTETFNTVNVVVDKDVPDEHLCYLVQWKLKEPRGDTYSEWSNLGYAFGGVFVDDQRLDDPSKYEKYEYRVCAMDRSFHTTAWSPASSFAEDAAVFEVETGDGASETFADLNEAIECAWQHKEDGVGTVLVAGDAMVSSAEVGNRMSIVLKPKEGDVEIGRAAAGPMITVKAASTLTIAEGDDGSHITLDGYFAEGNRAGVLVAGAMAKLAAHGVTFENFVNTASNAAGQGGAVSVPYENGLGHTLFEGCTFRNNRASDGGAIASRGTTTIKGCTFESNTATDEGGALRNHDGGIVYCVDSEFRGNSGVWGGAVSASGFTLLSSVEIRDNMGKWGGGIDARPGAATRNVILTAADDADASHVTNNTAQAGSAVYAGDTGPILIGKAELAGAGETSTIEVRKGEVILNADLEDANAANGNLRGGSLKDFGDQNVQAYIASDGTTTRVDGTVAESGTAYVREANGWHDGSAAFSVADLGRPEPVVAVLGDGDIDGDEALSHVILADGAHVALEYRAAAEDGGTSGVFVSRGGEVELILGEDEAAYIKSGDIDGYTSGVKTYLPTEVIRPGYVFVGWFDNPDCTGISKRYVDEDQVGKATYWAKWSKGAYWVNYRPNGGSMPEDTVWHRSIEETTLLVDPIRADYSFLGWYPDSEFKKPEMTSIPAGTEGDVAVYARYDHHRNGGEKHVVSPATCTTAGLEAITYKCVDCEDQPMGTELRTIPATGHKWGGWQRVENPQHACGINKDFSYRVCSVCGAKETNLTADEKASAEHSWGDGEKIADATCTKEGTVVYTCTKCHAVRSEAIPRLTHVWDESKTREVTRSEAKCHLVGVVDVYKTCSVCGKEFLAATDDVPALEHVWKTDYPATVSADGSAPVADEDGWVVKAEHSCATGAGEIRYRTCAVCGYVETVQDEFDHLWEQAETIDIPASCTSPGWASIHCTECGATKGGHEIAQLDHDFTDVNRKTCANCNTPNPYWKDPDATDPQPEPPAAHVHTWSGEYAENPAATCTEPGVRYQWCTQPGCTERHDVQVVPAKGHDFGVDGKDEVCLTCGAANEHLDEPHYEHVAGEWATTVEADCIHAGLRTLHCAKCGRAMDEEVVEPLGHDFVEGKCSRCGEAPDDPWNEDHEHEFSNDWVVIAEPTCTDDGLRVHRCVVCGLEGEAEAISALDHLFEAGEPTCTRDGCDEPNPDYVAPHDHVAAMDDVVEVPPTCTAYGVDARVCSVCGEVVEELAVEPLGHDFGPSGDADRCSRCGVANPSYEGPSGGEDEPPEETHDHAAILARYAMWAAEHASELDEALWTEGSWVAFDEARDEFLAAARDISVADSAVEDFYEAMLAAFRGLVAKGAGMVDKSGLQEAIDRLSAIDLSLYTDDSARAMRDALSAARAIMADADATADDVKGAFSALLAAEEGLVRASGGSGQEGQGGPSAGGSSTPWAPSGASGGVGGSGQAQLVPVVVGEGGVVSQVVSKMPDTGVFGAGILALSAAAVVGGVLASCKGRRDR